MKTITARSMAEALATVRRELGANAVVLHTRQYRRGGVFGIGAQTVVEVTAADGAAVGKRVAVARNAKPAPTTGRRPAQQQRQPQHSLQSPQYAQQAPQHRPQESLPQTAGDLIRRTYQAARAEFEQQRPAASPLPVAAPPPDTASLAEEVRTVKRLVERMMHEKRHAPPQPQPDVSGTLFDQYLNLLRHEVTEELAREIIGQVQADLSPQQLEDTATVRRAVLEAVADLIPSCESELDFKPTGDGRPRTIALVGPTGVGKTTTIAKLAATFKLKRGRNVGLITLDTYRIAAVEQLRTYANIIGVPLQVASSEDELRAAIARTRGCDVVLIDTAGRSQKDDPRLAQLRSFINAADPHEVHLVLSSTCTQAVMLEAIERFSTTRADRIIFTKLDEAVSFGVLLNVARKVNKQLSYITTGQEVPHQIEPGQPRRLAELVMGEGIES